MLSTPRSSGGTLSCPSPSEWEKEEHFEAAEFSVRFRYNMNFLYFPDPSGALCSLESSRLSHFGPTEEALYSIVYYAYAHY